ncbi:unnamed protein product [Ectocarpus sp. 12 AP-2014]
MGWLKNIYISHCQTNMITLLLFILVVGMVCFFLTNGEEKRQQIVVAEDVYPDVGTAPPDPPPPQVCPEMKKLEALVGAFETTQNWALLVQVGDAYERGCFPFYGGDAGTACRLYRLASQCPDLVVAARAMSRFAHMRLHPISPRDSVGKPFPAEIAKTLCRHAEYHIQRCPPTFNRTRCKPKPRDEPEAQARVVAAAPAPHAHVVAVAPVLPTDTQNVHDHSIAQITKKNVKDIIDEAEQEYDRVELVDSVMSDLRKTGLSEEILGDAFRVLVSLIPGKIESMGCSQTDVLHATRARIDSIQDKGVKSNLYETLGKNLASGVERGHVVCSTGKIARIVGTLEGADLVKNKAVPIEVIRREIGALASKIRTDVLSEVSQKQVTEYNTSSLSGLSVTMRERFECEVNAIYIEGLGLSPKVLSPIKALYSSEF